MRATRWSNGRIREVAASIVFLLSATAGSGWVAADQNGVGDSISGRLADNHDHDRCWYTEFTTTNLRDNASNAHINLHNQTSFSGGSLQTCNSGTDVHWMGVYTVENKGRYECFDTAANHVCDRAYAKVSTNTNILPVSSRWHTTCHELGHSTGASHHVSGTSWGCMTFSSASVSYVSHTIAHMNSLSYQPNTYH